MKYLKTYEKFEQSFDSLYKIAKDVDYETFLSKTDSLTSIYNILYRGMVEGGSLVNMSFMTDYIGHAREYGEADVDGIIYNDGDILYFNDNVFNNLRKKFNNLTKKDLKEIYSQYFKNYKLFDAMEGEYETERGVIKFVFNFINSDTPYTKIQQNKIKNDLLIPIMQHYATINNKNIISFLGGDYLDYGGADEFVVYDISGYTTLKEIWKKSNS